MSQKKGELKKKDFKSSSISLHCLFTVCEWFLIGIGVFTITFVFAAIYFGGVDKLRLRIHMWIDRVLDVCINSPFIGDVCSKLFL